MEKNRRLAGIIPVIPTPFTDEEEVDQDALRGLVEFAISSGIKGICLPAYASEFYKLSDVERLSVVKTATQQASGRVQVVAQANSPSLKIAVELARSFRASGADVISIAVPRQFHLPEVSLKEYLSTFLKSLAPTPVLIQDFNPGGPSLSVSFIADLHSTHSNFKYLKLEEPLSAQKVRDIINVSQGEIDVFEGWGGLYLLELVPVGITGVMPGLGLADLLQTIFNERKKGSHDRAFSLFERVMPQISYSLQTMELFHYAEKELLVARGILRSSRCRRAAYVPDRDTVNYIAELNNRIVKFISEHHDLTGVATDDSSIL